ncbi:hypothetical protein DXG01_001137, partial [Tephrocybe rancida]
MASTSTKRTHLSPNSLPFDFSSRSQHEMVGPSTHSTSTARSSTEGWTTTKLSTSSSPRTMHRKTVVNMCSACTKR